MTRPYRLIGRKDGGGRSGHRSRHGDTPSCSAPRPAHQNQAHAASCPAGRITSDMILSLVASEQRLFVLTPPRDGLRYHLLSPAVFPRERKDPGHSSSSLGPFPGF